MSNQNETNFMKIARKLVDMGMDDLQEVLAEELQVVHNRTRKIKYMLEVLEHFLENWERSDAQNAGQTNDYMQGGRSALRNFKKHLIKLQVRATNQEQGYLGIDND